MFRTIAAILLLIVGIVLIVPMLQARLSLAAAPLGNWMDQRFGGTAKRGLTGQFGVGVLLGAVWIPCIGATLGAASVLAAQGPRSRPGGADDAGVPIGSALPMHPRPVLTCEAVGKVLSRSDAGDGRYRKLDVRLVQVRPLRSD